MAIGILNRSTDGCAQASFETVTKAWQKNKAAMCGGMHEACARGMKAQDFRRWRKAHGLKQREAADALGLKKRVIQYYEKGDREGKKVAIPRTVALACYAISQGVTDYDASEIREDGS